MISIAEFDRRCHLSDSAAQVKNAVQKGKALRSCHGQRLLVVGLPDASHAGGVEICIKEMKDRVIGEQDDNNGEQGD